MRQEEIEKNWVYFNKIDQLLYKNPAIDPPVLLHNGKRVTASVSSPLSSLEDKGEETLAVIESAPGSSGKSTPDLGNRKNSNNLQETLTTLLEQNERHHKEELEEKRRFNNLLEILIKKAHN